MALWASLLTHFHVEPRLQTCARAYAAGVAGRPLGSLASPDGGERERIIIGIERKTCARIKFFRFDAERTVGLISLPQQIACPVSVIRVIPVLPGPDIQTRSSRGGLRFGLYAT